MIIETKGLRKSYRSRQGRELKTVEAVRGVDMTVAEGEIFGFLGPNGAGKTTTLRMFATLIEPDGGEAVIAGVDLRRDPGEVRRLRGEGMTIFITTHYMDEADALCDRVAIIDYGRIVAIGTPDALKREISGEVVTVGLNGEVSLSVDMFDTKPYVRKLEIHEGQLRLYVENGATAVPQVMHTLEGANLIPHSIEVHRPSLDDVFLAKTGRSLREN